MEHNEHVARDMTREQMIDEAVRRLQTTDRVEIRSFLGFSVDGKRLFEILEVVRVPPGFHAEFRRIADAEKFVARPGKPEILQAASRVGKSFPHA